MLTVMEMLSHPAFSDFRLITNKSGLNNRIRDAAILEWESGEDLDEGFSPGDFVVTTLTAYRDSPELADLIIVALLEKNIAGLAIRDIYFSNLPEEIVYLADEMEVPIFMFTESKTSDIVYALKSDLAADEINASAMRKVRQILYQSSDEADTEILARGVNPYFTNNLICIFGLPVDYNNKDAIIDKIHEGYKNMLQKIEIDPEVSYSILFFSMGICLIYSDPRAKMDLREGATKLLAQFPTDTTQFALGISDPTEKLSDIGFAIRQSLYASADAHVNGVAIQDYNKMGFTRVLCPLRNDFWMKGYYDDLYNRINEYDEKHDAHLYETIADYVHCNGDINAAAELSFQHPNTIRYRIKKVQEVLRIENALDVRIQLFTLVRLRELSYLLVDWRV